LKDLKESYPIQVAEYAVANGIDKEPAFKWWVLFTLKKRNRIVSKVKSKYWKTNSKFGIRIPKTVEEAYQIDKETGTLHWTNAIEKEMRKILSMQSFEIVEGVTPKEIRGNATKLPGYKEIGVHMIFDIKMDGKFTQKARLVANGNKTPAIPQYDKYLRVVSRESVRIGLLYAALNDLEILTCNISNAYLNAKCPEPLWTEAGTEFGPEWKGRVLKMMKAVYGTQSAGAAWHQTLATTLHEIGFTPSKGNRMYG